VIKSGWWVRAATAPLFVLQGWALLLSQSRTVWIALCVGIFFCFKPFVKGAFLKSKIVLGGIFIAAAVVFWSGHKAFCLVAERFSQLGNFHETPYYTLIFRLELWRGCWEAFIRRPWGWGTGAFSAVFPMFRINDDRFLVDYAHNEFAQIGVDFGIPGIFFLIGFIFFYLKTAAVASRDARTAPGFRIYAVAFFSLFLSLLITCQFDFPIRIYSNGLLFVAFLGLSAFLFAQSDQCPHRAMPPVASDFFSLFLRKGVCLALVLCSLTLTATHLYAQFSFEEGLRSQKRYEMGSARNAFERAVRWMPFCENYQKNLGEFYSKMAFFKLEPASRRELREKAADAYRKAIDINAYESANHYLLARILEELGDLTGATVQFREAMEYDPVNAYYVLEYAYFCLRCGRVEEAIEKFEKYSSFKFREYPGGDICAIVRKLSERTRRYEDLKRVVPDEWPYHFCLGATMVSFAQWDFARFEFDRVLEQARMKVPPASYHENIRRAVAASYSAAGRYAEVLRIYRRDLERDPSDSAAAREISVMAADEKMKELPL
jgi:tetratricopeptide (TPR) repeat protein